MTQLQPIFLKNFSKNRITYGPNVGKKVNFRVVADKDFKTEVENEAKRLAAGLVGLYLKFAPDRVRDKLVAYYRVLKQPFPNRLSTINENTQLTRDEVAAVFPLMQALTIEKAKADSDKVGAFYSPSTNEMVFRVSNIDAGSVAHEMTHAYANQGWLDFINLMRLRGMSETVQLDEGMTQLMERVVVLEWHSKQPSTTLIPTAAYGSTFSDKANEFVKQLGKDVAFEAYFGGWINFTSNDKPEDTLEIGNTTKKKWKWPWRSTTTVLPRRSTTPIRPMQYFRWVFR